MKNLLQNGINLFG